MVDWKERYMREVEGLNNEGDPIGGDPPSGFRHVVEALKAENEALRKQLDVAILQIKGVISEFPADDLKALKAQNQVSQEALDAAMKPVVVTPRGDLVHQLRATGGPWVQLLEPGVEFYNDKPGFETRTLCSYVDYLHLQSLLRLSQVEALKYQGEIRELEVAYKTAGDNYSGAIREALGLQKSKDDLERQLHQLVIETEKRLCAILGRDWSAAGISVDSLLTELERLSRAPTPMRDAVIKHYYDTHCRETT